MKKRIIAFLLCFALVMPILPASATETEPTGAAASESTVTSAPTTPSEPAPSTETTAPAPAETTEPTPTETIETDPVETDPVEIDPTEAPTAPSETPTDPTEDTTPTDPSGETTAPSEEATDPTEGEDTTEPSEEPTEPEMTAEEVEALYNAIMACASVAEVDALLGNMTEEEYNAFLSALTADQYAALDTHLDALYDFLPEGITVPKPAVNYWNAAPFGEPAEGQSIMRMMRLMTTAEEKTDNGLELTKAVSAPNSEGEYTLTLEAWATGAKTITSVSESVPTDIILVLDQSGSMSYCMYANCNTENCDGKHGNSSYTAVYDVSSSDGRTYYMHSYGQYYQLYYCSSCQGWYTQQHGNRHNGTKYTPRTSANGSGTIFYVDNSTTYDSRIDALRTAVTQFVASVNEKTAGLDKDLSTTADNIDHRIAIVGFASQSGYGNNTEVLTVPGTNSGSVGVAYNNLSNANYQAALQDVSTVAGQTMVANAINALATQGATQVNLGITMANNIFAQNPIPTGEKRNRVVIVFTDGAPTSYSSYEASVANGAISGANTSKNTYSATVYSIGIFGGADGSNPASLPANNDTDSNRENRFLHLVSSNYPNATNMTTPGTINANLNGKSYYLSASNSETLTNIFETISSEIESGGAATTLTESAVVKDVISDQFELPEGANVDNIKVYTAAYTAADTFAERTEFTDATISISDDTRNVSVSNFNFSENWVGTENNNGTVTYRGKKLIIEIPIVVRDGFLGGNDVITNGSGSGVYENDSAQTPIEEFVSPTVDVQIKEVTVTVPDYNVYLLDGVTAEQLEAGLNVSVGDVALDMDAENYGLQSWQNAYVTIGDGDNMTALNDLTADTTYSATVTVTPNTTGTATEKSGNGTGNINVFKPVITWQDSQINAGETPDYETDNLKSVVWKHGETLSTAVTMTGSEPTLSYTYSPPAGPLNEDTPVDVTVKVGERDITAFVTFEHIDCNFDGCAWVEAKKAGKEFIVHIKSFDLTVVKDVVAGDAVDQSFLFNITCPDGSTMRIVINGEGQVTIADLPTGTYTITEDTSWSWRYDIVGSAEQTVTPGNIINGTATVTFTNGRTDDQWLDGSSYAKNSFSKLAAE